MNSKIAIIINAHKEGALLFPTVKSACECVNELKKFHSVEIEFLFYLDKPDAATLEIAKALSDEIEYTCRIVEGKNGDPGLSRSKAVKLINSEYVAFLDGDDLWSKNWLRKCYEYINENGSIQNCVLHPEFNYIFGSQLLLVRQGPLSNIDYRDKNDFLRVANYWDAMCFAERDLFLENPIPSNDKENGFAHEDFLWNCETILNGVSHVEIPCTIHFKRRRQSSVSSLANAKSERVKPTQLSRY